jgi:hypothetical protein
MRVSSKVTNLRSGKSPSTGTRERFNECSSCSEGLLNEKNPVAAMSDKTEEERPVLDAVISIQHESEESSSPMTQQLLHYPL